VKILFILTYYRPHVSGLTIYVERLARALAERGHSVTVLTSQYADSLPREELLDGVRVVRIPVAFRFNKGVFMPGFIPAALREIRAHDVASIHLPQVEAALVTLLARLAGRKPILTYHCDLQMPPVWYGRIIDKLTFWDNLIAGKLADTIVAYTEDFARHSPFLSRFGIADCGLRTERDQTGIIRNPAPLRSGDYSPQSTIRNSKVRVILPPVVIPEPTPEGVAALKVRAELNGKQRVIGFAARFAYEKGVGYLINAIPHILDEIPEIRVLFAGPYKDVIGETIWDEMQPLVKEYEHYLTFLGTLNPAQMADFFRVCDVVTVASINNTESFGLVEVESFMCGTPVVATDLPGVRVPVTMTGMGEIVPVADAVGLAQGVIKVLKDRSAYVKPRSEVMRIFELQRTVDEYEKLFMEMR
jgi:glycosyltransferase involved in cell wall biosynthesis